jgi:hypothetical protein
MGAAIEEAQSDCVGREAFVEGDETVAVVRPDGADVGDRTIAEDSVGCPVDPISGREVLRS